MAALSMFQRPSGCQLVLPGKLGALLLSDSLRRWLLLKWSGQLPVSPPASDVLSLEKVCNGIAAASAAATSCS
jgi:hypothetical protein